MERTKLKDRILPIYTKGEENAGYQLSQIDGIDLLVNGHTHQVFPGNSESINNLPNVDIEKGTINGMATMLPGSFGQYLGVADLKLKEVDGKWKVVDGSTELRKVDKSVDEDENFNEIIARAFLESTVWFCRSRCLVVSCQTFQRRRNRYVCK